MAPWSRVPPPIVIQIPPAFRPASPRPQRESQPSPQPANNSPVSPPTGEPCSYATRRIKLIFISSVLLALCFLLLCLGWLGTDCILWAVSFFLKDKHAKEQVRTLVYYFIGIGFIGTITNGLGVLASTTESLELSHCFALSSFVMLITFLYFLFTISPWPFFLILVGLQTILFVLAVWHSSDLQKQYNAEAARVDLIARQSNSRPQSTHGTNMTIGMPRRPANPSLSSQPLIALSMPMSVPPMMMRHSIPSMTHSYPGRSMSSRTFSGPMSLPSSPPFLYFIRPRGTPPPPYSNRKR